MVHSSVHFRRDWLKQTSKIAVALDWNAIVAIAAITAYSLLVFDRFMPITEGWFSAYAHLMNEGQVPYRDFYLFLPPAYPMMMAAITYIFGTKIIVLRIAGVLLSALFTGGLYLLLKTVFRPWVANVAAVTATIYYQNGNAFIAYDFVQVMNVSIIFGAYFIMRYATDGTPHRTVYSSYRFAFIAGLFLSTASMVKQSNGSVVTFFCGVAILAATVARPGRSLLGAAASYVLGCVPVPALISLWLVAHAAFAPFVAQAINGAIGAKGSLPVILFKFLGNFFGPTLRYQMGWIVYFAWIPLVWVFLAKRFPSIETDRDGENGPVAPILIALVAVGVLVISWNFPVGLENFLGSSWRDIGNYIIPIAVLGPVAVVVCRLVASPGTARTQLIVVIISTGIIWGNGTSAGLSSTGVFLGVALAMGILLSHKGFFLPVALITMFYSTAQCAVWCNDKYSKPYYWWGVSQADVRGQLASTDLPMLKGIRASADTMAVFERVTQAIEASTSETDRILVFPHTPIFYQLASRRLMGRAVVEWFDFLPDNLARSEANILRDDPPRLIVWLEMPETVWSEHERLFRGGARSGQRDIHAALMGLVDSGRATLLQSIPVQEGFTFQIYKVAIQAAGAGSASAVAPSPK